MKPETLYKKSTLNVLKRSSPKKNLFLHEKCDTQETSSSMFVMFRHLHEPDSIDTFSEDDKVRLKLGLALAIECSLKGIIACVHTYSGVSGIIKHIDKTSLWFGVSLIHRFVGLTDRDRFEIIKNGLKQMHNVMTDPNESLIFVDQRVICLPYKKSIDLFHIGSLEIESTGPALLRRYRTQGKNVYVNQTMLDKSNLISDLARDIYAMLTQYVLNTTFLSHDSECDVYQKRNCITLAREDPDKALLNAKCWENFIFSFMPP
ncbi:MAG: hypothetical protein KAH18_07960 [Psychromonas sp.]|nr:hypothetical protein [Psychromonas sp.]